MHIRSACASETFGHLGKLAMQLLTWLEGMAAESGTLERSRFWGNALREVSIR